MHLPGTILIFMEVMGVQSFIYLIVLSTATIHQTHMDQASLGRQNSPTSQATSRHYFLPGIRTRPPTKLTFDIYMCAGWNSFIISRFMSLFLAYTSLP